MSSLLRFYRIKKSTDTFGIMRSIWRNQLYSIVPTFYKDVLPTFITNEGSPDLAIPQSFDIMQVNEKNLLQGFYINSGSIAFLKNNSNFAIKRGKNTNMPYIECAGTQKMLYYNSDLEFNFTPCTCGTPCLYYFIRIIVVNGGIIEWWISEIFKAKDENFNPFFLAKDSISPGGIITADGVLGSSDLT